MTLMLEAKPKCARSILRVSGADAGVTGSKHFGPITQLPGNNNRPMSQFNIGIKFYANGSIQNVLHNGKTYSVEDWNKRFQSQNPQSSSTSSNNQ
jgi:hypothetical protein